MYIDKQVLLNIKEELRWGDAENAIVRVERMIDQALSGASESGVERWEFSESSKKVVKQHLEHYARSEETKDE